MSSEKKRRRSGTDEEKAERKRLKKEQKAAAAKANGDAADGNGVNDDVAVHDTEPQKADETTALVSPIASPMAGKKLTKKVFKTIAHAAKEKSLRRGVKEVALGLRKNDKGVVVMAGDVFPIEVICHIPLMCEEANVPYCFVSRRTELGAAGLTKRPTSVVLVSEAKGSDDFKTEVAALKKEVQAIQNIY